MFVAASFKSMHNIKVRWPKVGFLPPAHQSLTMAQKGVRIDTSEPVCPQFELIHGQQMHHDLWALLSCVIIMGLLFRLGSKKSIKFISVVGSGQMQVA